MGKLKIIKPKEKHYIPVDAFFLEMFANAFPKDCTAVRRFPIKNIRFNKRLLPYNYTGIDYEEVDYLVNNFYLESWEPFKVNKDYYLIDDRNRLEAAKRMKLRYVDIIIDKTPTYSWYYGFMVDHILTDEEWMEMIRNAISEYAHQNEMKTNIYKLDDYKKNNFRDDGF
jgi:hypothetical protein